MPKRSAAAADKILKSKKSSAHNKNNRQMTSAQRAQTFALNSEIAKLDNRNRIERSQKE